MSNVIMDERELAERSKAADDSMEKLRRMRDGSDYERGRRDGRREAFEEAAHWCDVERVKVAVNGYDYHSGEEYGLANAIREYADLWPHDLTSPAELQRNLRAIAGAPHTHKAGMGPNIDTCAVCGRDIRDPVHSRAS